MVIVELSVVPLGIDHGFSRYVAKVVKLLEDKGVKYQLTPMGTIIETEELGEALKIIEDAHELMFKEGLKRVYTVVKIDDRRDVERSMEDKVSSVMEKVRGG